MNDIQAQGVPLLGLIWFVLSCPLVTARIWAPAHKYCYYSVI